MLYAAPCSILKTSSWNIMMFAGQKNDLKTSGWDRLMNVEASQKKMI